VLVAALSFSFGLLENVLCPSYGQHPFCLDAYVIPDFAITSSVFLVAVSVDLIRCDDMHSGQLALFHRSMFVWGVL